MDLAFFSQSRFGPDRLLLNLLHLRMLLHVSWHHTHVDHLLLHVWMHALHLGHTHDRHTKLHGSNTRQIRLVHHAWWNLVGITLQSTGLLHLDHLLHVH